MKTHSLTKWKKANDLSYQKIAEMFSISKTYAYFLISGKRTPGFKLAVKIHELTGIPFLSLLKNAPAGDQSGESKDLNDHDHIITTE